MHAGGLRGVGVKLREFDDAYGGCWEQIRVVMLVNDCQVWSFTVHELAAKAGGEEGELAD